MAALAGGIIQKEFGYKICKFPLSPCGVGKGAEIAAKIGHHQGELFPSVGYIVTNLKWHNKRDCSKEIVIFVDI